MIDAVSVGYDKLKAEEAVLQPVACKQFGAALTPAPEKRFQS